MIVNLCRMFGCLPWPGALMEQPAELLRLVAILERGTPQQDQDAAAPDGW